MSELTETIDFPIIENLSDQWDFFNKAIQSFEKKTVKFSDKSWDYWIRGNGEETLVFFHGAMIGPKMFFYPAYMLAEKYKVIVTLIPENLSTIEELINVYEALLKKEDLKKVTLIGYSYGGGLVQTLMDFIPEKINCVALSHTGLLWGRDKPKGTFLIKILLKIFPLSKLKKVLLKKRLNDCPDSEWNEFYKQFFTQKIENLKKSTVINYLRAVTKLLKSFQQQEPKERKFKGKVILLGTEGDEKAFYALKEFGNIFPNAQKYIFKKSGGHHFIFLHPREYTMELYKLLKTGG